MPGKISPGCQVLWNLPRGCYFSEYFVFLEVFLSFVLHSIWSFQVSVSSFVSQIPFWVFSAMPQALWGFTPWRQEKWAASTLESQDVFPLLPLGAASLRVGWTTDQYSTENPPGRSLLSSACQGLSRSQLHPPKSERSLSDSGLLQSQTLSRWSVRAEVGSPHSFLISQGSGLCCLVSDR